MDALTELDELRKKVIYAQAAGLTELAPRLLALYEKRCRARGIDPDTWEGLGR